MPVQVGQTLDKYELLERVGQGGMAIVYRGHDNSLRREVAVKVLHQHLAEHREARERFEREAHAVAKLRHENILEIYDFSGTESAESYIVTEFIDGLSLKEFITEHTIKFPEVGAMITLQVCKALQHAHSHGILHRDVKPENVMIRSDGVVKLTDFGIAQMIDLQRLTVTGQLLGSPAYMSPEHVNGGQLDFRTDVFALGIMLYQLITGELPFKGKNPHEILKRIAEGEYLDPSVVNPHVGKELRQIIRKSMARDKEDRYADVSLMLSALEQFIVSAGLGTARDELARYFDAPVPFEMALHTRLVEHLTRVGKDLVDNEKPAALEAFNRVLTLEPDNSDVLAVLDRIGTHQKRRRILGVMGAIAIASGLGYGTKTMLKRGEGALLAGLPSATLAARPDRVAVAGEIDAAPPAIDAGSDAAPADASGLVRDAGRVEVAVLSRRDAAPPFRVDAAPTAGQNRSVFLSVFPWVDSEYRVNGGSWTRVTAASRSIIVPSGPAQIEARNTRCCLGGNATVPSSATDGRKFSIKLPFRPAKVTPKCSVEGALAKVNGRPIKLGTSARVEIDGNSLTGTEVIVTFYARADAPKSFFERKRVKVGPADVKVVACEP